jgi:hypothetical protein
MVEYGRNTVEYFVSKPVLPMLDMGEVLGQDVEMGFQRG